MGISYNPSIVTEGLVLALDPQSTRSYVGSGTAWTDLTNRGNSGTLTNGPVFIPGGPFNNSGGSVYFDGTDDHLNIATASGVTVGTGDFTIEYWINLATSRTPSVWWASGTSSVLISDTSAAEAVIGSSTDTASGYSKIIDASSSLAANTWGHVAVVRSSGTTTIYLDGVSGGTTTSITGSFDCAYIGRQKNYSPRDLNGYISNLRVIKGTALYTSNFTPPTGPLEAINDTVLLTCQGGAITDNGPNSHAITVNNDAKAITASAFEFDGTDDYVSITNISNGTDDFTYEAWVYPTESGKDNPAILYTSSLIHVSGIYNTSGGTNAIFGASTRPGSGNYVLYAPDITLNTWHHIVWVKSGSSLKIYVDGVNQTLTDSGSFSGTQSNNVSYIGTTVSNEYFEGSISNVKIYKGKGLTEDEVKRNFNALRGRYGI